MDAKSALNLFFERSNAMQMFWSLYIPIVLGIMAFFGAGSQRSRIPAASVTFAFVSFATVNY